MSTIIGRGITVGGKFDFSAATVTVDDLPYDVYAWDANGVLIGRNSTPGEYHSRIIAGTLTKGSFVRFDGLDWIIANVSGNTYTLMLKKMTETTIFRSSGTTYSGSAIASKCTAFQKEMSIEALSVVNSKTLESVTTKVWIATQSDITSWTESGTASSDWSGIRKWSANDGIYDSVGAQYYWCFGQYDSGRIRLISCWGNFGISDPSYSQGFRPCIEVVQ